LICCPTVPHSGSHLLFVELLNTDYKGINKKPWFHWTTDFTETGENTVIWNHLKNDAMVQWKKLFKQHPIVTPIRHPWRIAQSHIKRQKKDLKEFHEHFNNLMNIVDKYNPLYIHIDHESRESDIKKLSKLIGRKVKTDWPVSKRTGCLTHTHDFNGVVPLPDNYLSFYESTFRGQ